LLTGQKIERAFCWSPAIIIAVIGEDRHGVENSSWLVAEEPAGWRGWENLIRRLMAEDGTVTVVCIAVTAAMLLTLSSGVMKSQLQLSSVTGHQGGAGHSAHIARC
jgi:hypothetical protein